VSRQPTQTRSVDRYQRSSPLTASFPVFATSQLPLQTRGSRVTPQFPRGLLRIGIVQPSDAIIPSINERTSNQPTSMARCDSTVEAISFTDIPVCPIPYPSTNLLTTTPQEVDLDACTLEQLSKLQNAISRRHTALMLHRRVVERRMTERVRECLLPPPQRTDRHIEGLRSRSYLKVQYQDDVP